MKLFTMNLSGNLHQSSEHLNEMGLSDYVIQLHYVSPGNTIAVLKISDDVYAKLKSDKTTRKLMYLKQKGEL